MQCYSEKFQKTVSHLKNQNIGYETMKSCIFSTFRQLENKYIYFSINLLDDYKNIRKYIMHLCKFCFSFIVVTLL